MFNKLLWMLGIRKDSKVDYFGHKIVWPQDRQYQWWACEAIGNGYFSMEMPKLKFDKDFPDGIWHGGRFLRDRKLTWENATNAQKDFFHISRKCRY